MAPGLDKRGWQRLLGKVLAYYLSLLLGMVALLYFVPGLEPYLPVGGLDKFYTGPSFDEVVSTYRETVESDTVFRGVYRMMEAVLMSIAIALTLSGFRSRWDRCRCAVPESSRTLGGRRLPVRRHRHRPGIRDRSGRHRHDHRTVVLPDPDCDQDSGSQRARGFPARLSIRSVMASGSGRRPCGTGSIPGMAIERTVPALLTTVSTAR